MGDACIQSSEQAKMFNIVYSAQFPLTHPVLQIAGKMKTQFWIISDVSLTSCLSFAHAKSTVRTFVANIHGGGACMGIQHAVLRHVSKVFRQHRACFGPVPENRIPLIE